MKSVRLLVNTTKSYKDILFKKRVASTPASVVLNRHAPDNVEKFKFKSNTNGFVDRVYRANTFYKRLTGLKEREDLDKRHRTLQDQLYESTQKKIAYGIVLQDIKKKRAAVEEEISHTSRLEDFNKYSKLLEQEVKLNSQEKDASAQYDSQYAEESNLTSALSASTANICATELRRSDYFKIFGIFISVLTLISSFLSYVFQWGDFRTSLKQLQKDLEVLRERNDAGSYWEFFKQSGKTFASGSWNALSYGWFASLELGKFCCRGCATGANWCLLTVKTWGQGAYCSLGWVWNQTKAFMWKEEVKQENFVIRWSKKIGRGIKLIVWGE